MSVLAQDPNALKKAHADGWNLDPDSFPADTVYPGLYSGDYGPTEAVLAKAESPLDLFFFFHAQVTVGSD
ncbi:hypothetical protein V7S43_013689 [Phytophthora oleae]|uniref:Uncharacterized protein n=1 Tax=Phytophthora oleae TaxID=2107226 RepID=A0ABD3F4Q0_9STRA